LFCFALAANSASIKPEMKVISMSGYTGLAHPEHLDADAPLLAKPFTRDALLRKVRGALEPSNTLKSNQPQKINPPQFSRMLLCERFETPNEM
jgi:hypothetical protein